MATLSKILDQAIEVEVSLKHLLDMISAGHRAEDFDEAKHLSLEQLQRYVSERVEAVNRQINCVLKYTPFLRANFSEESFLKGYYRSLQKEAKDHNEKLEYLEALSKGVSIEPKIKAVQNV